MISSLSKGTLPITIVLAVRNESANLERCLQAVAPASEIIVADSGSTDGTIEIAERLGCNVVQFQHKGGYPKKRQWVLENYSFKTPWVLLLDADEVVTDELWDEISEVVHSESPCNGYLIRKGFHFLGRRMNYGGFSHEAVLLIRHDRARFEQLIEMPGDTLDMEVHERVIVDGPVGRLKSPLIHEDFKGLAAYIDKHNRYSSWEAFLRFNLLSTGMYGVQSVQPKLFGNAQERRRWLKRLAVRVPFEPWLWFIYHYWIKLGVLEGKPGLIASQIRAQYISNVRAKVWELHSRKSSNRPEQDQPRKV